MKRFDGFPNVCNMLLHMVALIDKGVISRSELALFSDELQETMKFMPGDSQ